MFLNDRIDQFPLRFEQQPQGPFISGDARAELGNRFVKGLGRQAAGG